MSLPSQPSTGLVKALRGSFNEPPPAMAPEPPDSQSSNALDAAAAGGPRPNGSFGVGFGVTADFSTFFTVGSVAAMPSAPQSPSPVPSSILMLAVLCIFGGGAGTDTLGAAAASGIFVTGMGMVGKLNAEPLSLPESPRISIKLTAASCCVGKLTGAVTRGASPSRIQSSSGPKASSNSWRLMYPSPVLSTRAASSSICAEVSDRPSHDKPP
mmetsp:Transcript_8485/g.31577  ORF Transcript_8485/g.31577 Transcript_8485/m.31577 type:complete len:212 (-) Transcript_8485:12312-12947(-)